MEGSQVPLQLSFITVFVEYSVLYLISAILGLITWWRLEPIFFFLEKIKKRKPANTGLYRVSMGWNGSEYYYLKKNPKFLEFQIHFQFQKFEYNFQFSSENSEIRNVISIPNSEKIGSNSGNFQNLESLNTFTQVHTNCTTNRGCTPRPLKLQEPATWDRLAIQLAGHPQPRRK